MRRFRFSSAREAQQLPVHVDCCVTPADSIHRRTVYNSAMPSHRQCNLSVLEYSLDSTPVDQSLGSRHSSNAVAVAIHRHFTDTTPISASITAWTFTLSIWTYTVRPPFPTQYTNVYFSTYLLIKVFRRTSHHNTRRCYPTYTYLLTNTAKTSLFGAILHGIRSVFSYISDSLRPYERPPGYQTYSEYRAPEAQYRNEWQVYYHSSNTVDGQYYATITGYERAAIGGY
jgi:hypothetical protein